MIGLPPSSAMPRSFLVKRGGIHFLRTQERSPSPGQSPVTYSELAKQTVSLDTSLEYSTTETPDASSVPVVLLQQGIQAANHPDGNVHLGAFSPKCYGG